MSHQIATDYQSCRDDGFGIAESIRTAVSMNPELSQAEAVKALATVGVNVGTARIQYNKSRAIDAELVL